MTTDAIAAMLTEDRARWNALVVALEAHTQESLHAAGSPPWVSRDVYAHLARWMEHSTADFAARIEGGSVSPIPGTDDEINGRWQAEDSGLSLDEARAWGQRAFDARVQAVEGVPAERWDVILAAVARADGSEHYAAHLSFIVAEQG